MALVVMKVDRKVSLVMYFCCVMFPFDGDVWRAIVDEQVETLNPT